MYLFTQQYLFYLFTSTLDCHLSYTHLICNYQLSYTFFTIRISHITELNNLESRVFGCDSQLIKQQLRFDHAALTANKCKEDSLREI